MTLPPGPRRPASLQILAWIRSPRAFMESCARSYGRRFTVRLGGGRSFVLIWDPEDVKAIFAAPEVFACERNPRFQKFVGENTLFFLDGEPHARHRRLLSPPFRGERMRAYGKLIVALTQRAIAAWPLGRPIRSATTFHDVTRRVIFEAVFGITDPAVAHELEATLDVAMSGASAALIFFPPLQVNLGRWSPWARYLSARQALDRIFQSEIDRARAAPAGSREDILAKLLEESALQGTPLADAELRDELLTLLVAGHETTTASLSWVVRRILESPEVHARVRDEVRAAVGPEGPDPAALGKLKYLEAVIHESMRLDPVIPIITRRLAAPARLGALDLPEGTFVCPTPHLAHRNPDVFPEPLRFDPERFMGKRPGPHEFFPFGGGNRICIGLPFALFEMKAVLATLFASADLALARPAAPRGVRRGVIIAPHDGTPVILERRRGG